MKLSAVKVTDTEDGSFRKEIQNPEYGISKPERSAMVANKGIENELNTTLQTLDKLKNKAEVEHDQEKLKFLSTFTSSFETGDSTDKCDYDDKPVHRVLSRAVSRSMEELSSNDHNRNSFDSSEDEKLKPFPSINRDKLKSMKITKSTNIHRSSSITLADLFLKSPHLKQLSTSSTSRLTSRGSPGGSPVSTPPRSRRQLQMLTANSGGLTNPNKPSSLYFTPGQLRKINAKAIPKVSDVKSGTAAEMKCYPGEYAVCSNMKISESKTEINTNGGLSAWMGKPQKKKKSFRNF